MKKENITLSAINDLIETSMSSEILVKEAIFALADLNWKITVQELHKIA